MVAKAPLTLTRKTSSNSSGSLHCRVERRHQMHTALEAGSDLHRAAGSRFQQQRGSVICYVDV